MFYKKKDFIFLYKKLLPILLAKCSLLKEEDYVIKEMDLWNYLVRYFWMEDKEYALCDLADDILGVDISFLEKSKDKEKFRIIEMQVEEL